MKDNKYFNSAVFMVSLVDYKNSSKSIEANFFQINCLKILISMSPSNLYYSDQGELLKIYCLVSSLLKSQT